MAAGEGLRGDAERQTSGSTNQAPRLRPAARGRPEDDTCRRQLNRQLTVQESRHKLARDVCHGKRGTIRQEYRDGTEDQLSVLGLVFNAIVLRTTKYVDAAVAQLHPDGHGIRDEDITRLSPRKHRNLNLLLLLPATTATPPPPGRRRPVALPRAPDAPELDEDDDDNGGQGWVTGGVRITPWRAGTRRAGR
ncbi:Tn3 family transposase [Streptomyces albus subsp. chlorinus]|nr:transposase [Streptomyces albus]NSC25669.1 Tn3 family transposase [Streptomyces albus subsp. chlorinus]